MASNILVLAPHTDDGELGAGASIAKWIRKGDRVTYAAMSGCESVVPAGLPRDTLRKELLAATGALGIAPADVIISHFDTRTFAERRQEVLETLLAFRRDIDPDMIVMPSLHDVHQDHAAIAQEGLRAFKNRTILCYEMPWNNFRFDQTVFSVVEEEDAERKISALACYASQANRPYMSPDFTRGQLRLRGVQVGVAYAEVFETPRLILPA